MKTFNASEIIESLNNIFPMTINHSGTSGENIVVNDFNELEEWDSASGELWANHLDQFCISADFDYNDLTKYGDSILFDYHFNNMVMNFINGNLNDCFNDLEELKENDSDSLIDKLRDEEEEVNILRLYIERSL